MLASSLLACAFILQTVPGTRPAPPRAGTATIRGRVTAADTGRPLRYVQVMLAPDMAEVVGGSATRSGETTTGADGSFEFTHLPAGRFTLFAGPMDMQSTYLPAVYGGDDQHPLGVAIELADDQLFDKADLRLPRGGVLAGRVVDEAGHPLTHVRVSLVQFDAKGAATPHGIPIESDDRGAFRLFGLQPGDWSVMASSQPPGVAVSPSDTRAGFLDTYYPADTNPSAAQRISLAPGQEIDDVVVQMQYGRLYRVAGVVLDPTGRPLSRAQVSLNIEQEHSSSATIVDADTAGRFTFGNVPAGRFVVTATPAPLPTAGPRAVGSPASFGRIEVTITDRDVDNLVLATASGVDVTGEIQFDPAPPDGRHTLELEAEPEDHSQMPVMATTRMDARGVLTFALEHLIGKYRIRAPALPPGSYVRSVVVNGQDVSDAFTEFTSGARLTVVVSTRAAAVSGRVTTSDGRPAARYVVFLMRADSDDVEHPLDAITAPDGGYAFETVPPGSYRVVALDPAHATSLESPAANQGGVAVTVLEGERAVVNVTANGPGGSD